MTNIFSTTDRNEFFDQLKERYGPQFQLISQDRKKIFRAALANYIAVKPVWNESENSITCMDCCIEGAGVDWDIWCADPQLCEDIENCAHLSDSDIEGLIESLTAQLKEGRTQNVY